MTFEWVQKVTDGLVCKLRNHCTQCVNKYTSLYRSIRNEFQYKDKQDSVSILKKISSDILVI